MKLLGTIRKVHSWTTETDRFFERKKKSQRAYKPLKTIVFNKSSCNILYHCNSVYFVFGTFDENRCRRNPSRPLSKDVSQVQKTSAHPWTGRRGGWGDTIFLNISSTKKNNISFVFKRFLGRSFFIQNNTFTKLTGQLELSSSVPMRLWHAYNKSIVPVPICKV